jgi:hypothetical protein
MRPLITFEEAQALIPKLARAVTAIEQDYPNARALPPMTVDEAYELINRLVDHAAQRVLTRDECFLHGQLISVYRMAVIAETLGKKGRYFCLSEDDLANQLGKL